MHVTGKLRKVWLIMRRQLQTARPHRPDKSKQVYSDSNENLHHLHAKPEQVACPDIESHTQQLHRPENIEIVPMIRHLSSPITNLPPEVILSIADFLDQATQVLLGLTCKTLHSVLTSRLDLSVLDVNVRTSLLRFVERDHPEYLTCRICGWMYIWRKTRRLNFTCPQSSTHPRFIDRAFRGPNVCIEHSVFMNYETRTLILRANSRGSQHGLPLTYLNANCVADDQVQCRTLARTVNGELMLTSEWSLDIDSVENMRKDLHLLDQGMCFHRWDITMSNDLHPTSFYQDIVSNYLDPDGVQGSVIAKCSYCATDYRAFTTNLETGGVRILLKVWQNFGNGRIDSLDVQQIFHTEKRPRLLRTDSLLVLELRDIEARFKSQGGDPTFDSACGHGGPDECSSYHE